MTQRPTPWDRPIPPITLLRFMPSAVRAQSLLDEARANDGKIDAGELDRIMIRLRDGGGLDDAERAALLVASKGPGFDDATRELLLQHVTAMAQYNAWVNIEVAGQVASIEGRYATMNTDVPGLSARLGMFDSTFSLRGQAAADGVLKMAIEGRNVSVAVRAGDQPAAIFEKLKDQLPAGVTGLTFGGDVQPYDPENFRANATSDGRSAAHMALYKPEALGLREGETPMRVIVTGYGPFQGITDNPSATKAQQIAEAGVAGGIVEYRRLDVTTGSVDRFISEMKASPPDVILSMGVGGATQIETSSRNWLEGHEPDGTPRTDGAGQVIREGRIDVSESERKTLHTDLPTRAIQERLGPDSGVGISTDETHDRSGYLCNYLGYRLADTFGGKGEDRERTAAGFMHVAPDAPPDKLHTVLEAATANQLEWRRHHAGQ
jgi:pyroglutamyl-peptidase